MINGLIVYNLVDQEKNKWFIEECIKQCNDDNFSLFYKEECEVLSYLEGHKVDFVIYRARDYKLVELLEQKGIKCFNNSLTNKTANDKYATYLLSKEQGINCLETLLDDSDNLPCPYIMKSLDGHGGQEVYLISDEKERLEILKKSQKHFIYQRYLPDCKDVRVYVLNNQVVAAVERRNSKDYRSNFSLGGEVKAYQPSQEMVDFTTKISKLLGATYIGVDFLIDGSNIYLNEIEDPVGARMLYKTSNIDIINLFIKEIKNQLL